MERVSVYSFPRKDLTNPPREREWRLEAVWEDGEWVYEEMQSVPEDADKEYILQTYDGPTVVAFEGVDLPDYLPKVPRRQPISLIHDTIGRLTGRGHSSKPL